MKECPFCREDNMSKSVFCCMCGNPFPIQRGKEKNSDGVSAKQRTFVPMEMEDQTKKNSYRESKRFIPM